MKLIADASIPGSDYINASYVSVSFYFLYISYFYKTSRLQLYYSSNYFKQEIHYNLYGFNGLIPYNNVYPIL